MRDELRTFVRRHGDAALAAALAALVLLEVVLSRESELPRVASAALAVALGAAAARRSRDPLPLLGLILLVSFATLAVPTLARSTNSGVFVFLLLAVYSAAAHTTGGRTLLAGGMTVALSVTMLALDGAGITADNLIFLAILLGGPWFAGRAIRQRRLNENELERERVRAAVAIVEERARIARELHDVVAHSISVMVLQARGGRHVQQSEPDVARDAFATIERTGHEALDEMRRLLGMLRRSEEGPPVAPQPGLQQLGTLVEQVEAAGLPVQVEVQGERQELPPGVDLSAFRIVQEALTNALRHAGPARARVTLRYSTDELELEIADDGPGSGDESAAGYGLIGMRERVSVYGGDLQAGPQPGGGYALRVRLPLRSARA